MFVHVSLEESFGVSVVEAMVAEVPVVAGAHSGAVPWVLDNGDAGVLVDIRSPADIADGIGRLLDNPEFAQGLVARARRRALTAFAPDAVAKAYIGEYERVLLQSKPGRRRGHRRAAAI